MKTPQKLMLVVLAVTAALAMSRLESVEVVQPFPTVTAPPPEQYRVIDTSTIPVANRQSGPGTLENVLNQLGAEGWRVRTTMGSTIILAK